MAAELDNIDEGTDLTEGFIRFALPDTWGIEKLACANFQSFDNTIDKVAARRGVDHAELREALAHWVDHDLDAAKEEYTVAEAVLDEAAEACTEVVLRDYEFLNE